MENGQVVKVSTAAVFGGKTVVLFAVPGAFTPGCSKTHCPSFVSNYEQFKEKKVDTIACTSVNDAFVMDAWSSVQRAEGKLLMLADGNGEFAKAVGLMKDATAYGMGFRCHRYAMIVVDQVVKYLVVDESGIEATKAENLLKFLSSK